MKIVYKLSLRGHDRGEPRNGDHAQAGAQVTAHYYKGEHKMKYEEIIKLLDAGYTRDEIMKMETEPKDPEPKDPEPKDPEPKDPEPKDPDVMTEIKDLFGDLKNELIASNILASQRQHDTENDVEQIIANVISPHNEKKGEDK